MSLFSNVLSSDFESHQKFVEFLQEDIASEQSFSELNADGRKRIGWSDWDSLHNQPKEGDHLMIQSGSHFDDILQTITQYLEDNGQDPESLVQTRNGRIINIVYPTD